MQGYRAVAFAARRAASIAATLLDVYALHCKVVRSLSRTTHASVAFARSRGHVSL